MHPLSLTGKRWIVPEDNPATVDLLRYLCAQHGVELEGEGASLPMHTLPDLPRAIARLERAVAHGETIGIFGDYDCDGITGAALLMRALRRRGADPVVRLPHRVHDGYGLSHVIVEEFADKNVTLLLTVDTGITAVEEIAQAAKKGIDVIVLDHHRLPVGAYGDTPLPAAHALLHPALAPAFPLPHPSGAGIAFGFVQALEAASWNDMDTDRALAALGTVADLVPLRGANRALVQSGLAAFGRITNGPLRILMEQAGCGAQVRSQDIAFRLAPRINAAGRMGDPTVALSALLGDGDALRQLEIFNRERQSDTALFVREAKDTAPMDDSCICIAREDYPPGVIGLIAGKLTDAAGRPSLVASIQGNLCTASLRSIPAYDIMEGLRHCACLPDRQASLFKSFGGHAQAAGCTFARENFETIKTLLCTHISSTVAPEDLQPSLSIDATIHPHMVTSDLCAQIDLLEPFGQGNPEPRFLIRGAVLSAARSVGKDAAHLQARLGSLKVIGFHLGGLCEEAAHPLDLACRIGMDTWNGLRKPQLFIDDMRITHTGANFPSMANTAVISTPSAAAIL